MPFIPGGLLFSGNPIVGVLQRQIEQMREEVLEAGPDVILANSEAAYVQYLVERYTLDVPELDMAGARQDVSEAYVPEHWPLEVNARAGGRMVLGTVYNLEIPYTGNKSFFYVRPNRYPTNHPTGFERDGHMIVPIAGGERMTIERVTEWFQSQPALIQQFLNLLREDALASAPTFLEAANIAVARRASKLRRDVEMRAAIPFPMKERAGAPRTYVAPTVKRRILPKLQRAVGVNAHPVLAEEHYQHILSVIELMTNVMERSPKAFATLKEEDIRVHYLVQLNGHYEGNATGETFNLEGKTDISIRDNAQVLFIAELKFWDGPRSLCDAIYQLLDYVTWRDTKTALVIFNRNADFSKVISAATNAMTKHPNYKSGPNESSGTRYRYVFTNRDDASREFSLTLLLFDVKA